MVGAFSGTRAELSEARWASIAAQFPFGGWWRVVAGADDGEHGSAVRRFATR